MEKAGERERGRNVGCFGVSGRGRGGGVEGRQRMESGQVAVGESGEEERARESK